MKTSIVRWSHMLDPNNPWPVHQSRRSETRSRSVNFVGMVNSSDPAIEWGDIDAQSSPSTAVVP
eukprot:276485-Prorocentrum_lima.AAC.1